MKLQRDSLISLIVGGVLIVLLPLLAALQYRWLGQVSEGEREQMKAGLQVTARRISDDFDQELTRVYVTYLTRSDRLSDESVFAERHQRWLDTAHDPRLVKAVFVASAKETDKLTLREFNASSNQFAAQSWPGEWQPLQSQLEQRLQATRAAFAERPPKLPPPPNLSPIFNGDLNALVVPITKIPQLGSGEQTPEIFGYAIVQLDTQFIQHEMLPNLVKAHLDVNNYDLAIQSRTETKKIIWQSAATDFSNPDTIQPLFGLRPSEIRNLLRSQQGQPSAPNPVTPRLGDSGGGGGGPFGSSPTGDNRAWELRIRHRAGSLDAAVAQVRRRNLLLSSGILLLLVSSIGLLMLSVRRAGKLAQQQMDFVAGVSHELRTPLAVIDSAGYNLTKGVVKDPQRIAHYGSLIRKETRRLQEMVEQILEFAGVQSGKQKYELLPTSVNQVINDVLSASQPLLAEGGFQLETNIAPDLPAVMADSPALGRALQNLLNNAMKYGGESRWIGVNAQATATPKGGEVRITVADHGLGISAEEQRHIFEPFYRGSEVKAAQIHGNGLGLSLVKNIVTAHNGRITVESTEGKGSQFTIALPAIAEEVMQASPLETTSRTMELN
ncbi:MAG TPA: HAMP domain-containing sensor histidine kinase [Blastocatellia bacterium]|nr:HAMP domain-containing sensor histidine kinase [Blastocatellia bacterium]